MANIEEQIADSFERHFNHHGFKKTSVEDVAKELKISKKTIYKTFDSKERIYYFIIKRIAKKYCQDMTKKLANEPSVLTKFANLITQIFVTSRKWIKTGNDAFEFKYKYEISEIAFQDAYSDLFNELLQKGIASGELTIDNVELTTNFIKGIISEAMKILHVTPELEIEADVIKSVKKLIQ